MVELETILCGTVSMEELGEFFKNGEFHEEGYLVTTIKRHLRTEEQRKLMFEHDLSIEDMLNGRYTGGPDVSAAVQQIFADWNSKLGHRAFGF